jgi:hypothetical protein
MSLVLFKQPLTWGTDLKGKVRCPGCGVEFDVSGIIPGYAREATMVCPDKYCHQQIDLYPRLLRFNGHGWDLPIAVARERLYR